MSLRSRSRAASAALAAVAILSVAAFGQSGPPYSELPNFYRVNEHLYRGGQPQPGGIKRLGELGVKTIVNLRGEQDLSRAEQKEAALAGIRYFNVPMAGIGRPSDAEVSRVMAIIDAPENWPVFIHCRRGSDRTGTVVACYRISHDRWDGQRATAEAKKFGMSWIESGMKGYIADYYSQIAAKSRAQVAAKPAAAKPAVQAPQTTSP